MLFSSFLCDRAAPLYYILDRIRSISSLSLTRSRLSKDVRLARSYSLSSQQRQRDYRLTRYYKRDEADGGRARKPRRIEKMRFRME